MYEELVKQMRFCADDNSVVECQDKCPNFENFRPYEYCFSKLIAEAADAIEELEEKAQAYAETLYAYEHPWIPLSSALPEDGSDILAVQSYCGEVRIIPANYDRGVWYDCVYNRVAEHITHWMPVPQPPKEDESEGEE